MGKGFKTMKWSLFNINDIVYYLGQLYRVMGFGVSGPYEGKLYLRRCGFEHTVGTWGWESYNRPFPVVAWALPSNPLLYHA